MAEYATSVNPRILRWARERSRLSLDQVAFVLKKDASIIESWEEEGDIYPTIGQLEKLAYQLYKRPLAIFFFPEPPEEKEPNKEFRTLPEFEIENLESDTLYALREARAMQLSLAELTDGENPAEKRIFEEIRPRDTKGIVALAKRVRDHLGIDLEEQTRWSNSDKAFKQWRNAVEHSGIFVFKRSFKQADISAFCILDSKFPIIYVNNGNSFNRQIFSLFHELAHIVFQTSGILKSDMSYIDNLTGRDQSIEIACNRFAAELLVPTEDFIEQTSDYSGKKIEVEDLSRRYSVSREVIYRRLLDRGVINEAEYKTKSLEWNTAFHRRSSAGSGGNHYATKAAYLGDNFLNLAFSRYNSGRCSIQELAEHLNMKARTTLKFENYLFGQI